MKKILILILLLSILPSCHEKTFFQLQIMLKNDTTELLNVKLFPKSAYTMGDLYDYGVGGGYKDCNFDIVGKDEVGIFVTEDLDIEPSELISQVFDSISINSADGTINMRFSSGDFSGYPVNIFNNSADWDYEIRNYDLPTMFSRNPVESHDYIFTIK